MNRIAIWIVSFLALLAGFIFESLWIRILSAFVLLIIIYVLCKRIKIQESEKDKKSNFYILISEAMLSNIFLSRTKDAWTYALSFASTVFFTCLIPLLTASSFNEFIGLKAI